MTAKRSVPDLLLEQYALGELNEAERSEIEAQLDSDLSLRERLAELKASDVTILAEARPTEMAAAIRRRLASVPTLASADGRAELGLGTAGRVAGSTSRVATGGAARARGRLLLFRSVPAALPIAAALLVMVGAVLSRGLLFPTASDLTRPKGGAPGLSIYKKVAAGPVELRDGSRARAGDILQIKYAAGAARYGAILSLDGRGTITRHFPPTAAGLAPSLAPEGAALGSAYELDDAPSFERFFIISSERDFDLAIATEALRALAASPEVATGSPKLPAGIEWKSILLKKEATR